MRVKMFPQMLVWARGYVSSDAGSLNSQQVLLPGPNLRSFQVRKKMLRLAESPSLTNAFVARICERRSGGWIARRF